MKTGTSVYITRDFPCSVGELYRWLVEPQQISEWFGPKHLSVVKAVVDLKVNGRYSFEMCKADDQYFHIEGTYLRIEQDHQLVFTLSYRGLGSSTPPDSVVSITLQTVEPQVTRLSLVQKFELVPSDMDSRTKAWKYMLSKLGHLLVDKPNNLSLD